MSASPKPLPYGGEGEGEGDDIRPKIKSPAESIPTSDNHAVAIAVVPGAGGSSAAPMLNEAYDVSNPRACVHVLYSMCACVPNAGAVPPVRAPLNTVPPKPTVFTLLLPRTWTASQHGIRIAASSLGVGEQERWRGTIRYGMRESSTSAHHLISCSLHPSPSASASRPLRAAIVILPRCSTG